MPLSATRGFGLFTPTCIHHYSMSITITTYSIAMLLASGREGLLHDLGLGPHLVEHDVLLALEAVEPDVLRPAGEEEEVGERAS